MFIHMLPCKQILVLTNIKSFSYLYKEWTCQVKITNTCSFQRVGTLKGNAMASGEGVS